MAETRESIGEFESSIFDASDGHKLVDLIRRKKGLHVQTQKIFDDVPSNRPSLQIEIERLNNQNEPLPHAEHLPVSKPTVLQKENPPETQPVIVSPKRQPLRTVISSPLKKMCSASLNRQTLLKEFEKVFSKSTLFIPEVCSTPILNQDIYKQSGENIVCSPITICDGSQVSPNEQSPPSIDSPTLVESNERNENLMRSLINHNEILNDMIQQEEVNVTVVNSEYDLRSPPKSRRTYTVQCNVATGNITLSPLKSVSKNISKEPPKVPKPITPTKQQIAIFEKLGFLNKTAPNSLNKDHSTPKKTTSSRIPVLTKATSPNVTPNIINQQSVTADMVERLQKNASPNCPVIVIPVNQTFNQAPMDKTISKNIPHIVTSPANIISSTISDTETNMQDTQSRPIETPRSSTRIKSPTNNFISSTTKSNHEQSKEDISPEKDDLITDDTSDEDTNQRTELLNSRKKIFNRRKSQRDDSLSSDENLSPNKKGKVLEQRGGNGEKSNNNSQKKNRHKFNEKPSYLYLKSLREKHEDLKNRSKSRAENRSRKSNRQSRENRSQGFIKKISKSSKPSQIIKKPNSPQKSSINKSKSDFNQSRQSQHAEKSNKHQEQNKQNNEIDECPGNLSRCSRLDDSKTGGANVKRRLFGQDNDNHAQKQNSLRNEDKNLSTSYKILDLRLRVSSDEDVPSKRQTRSSKVLQISENPSYTHLRSMREPYTIAKDFDKRDVSISNKNMEHISPKSPHRKFTPTQSFRKSPHSKTAELHQELDKSKHNSPRRFRNLSEIDSQMDKIRRSIHDKNDEQEPLYRFPPPIEFRDSSSDISEVDLIDEISSDRVALSQDKFKRPAEQNIKKKKPKRNEIPENVKEYLQASKTVGKKKYLNVSKRKLYSKGDSEMETSFNSHTSSPPKKNRSSNSLEENSSPKRLARNSKDLKNNSHSTSNIKKNKEAETQTKPVVMTKKTINYKNTSKNDIAPPKSKSTKKKQTEAVVKSSAHTVETPIPPPKSGPKKKPSKHNEQAPTLPCSVSIENTNDGNGLRRSKRERKPPTAYWACSDSQYTHVYDIYNMLTKGKKQYFSDFLLKPEKKGTKHLPSKDDKLAENTNSTESVSKKGKTNAKKKGSKRVDNKENSDIESEIHISTVSSIAQPSEKSAKNSQKSGTSLKKNSKEKEEKSSEKNKNKNVETEKFISKSRIKNSGQSATNHAISKKLYNEFDQNLNNFPLQESDFSVLQKRRTDVHRMELSLHNKSANFVKNNVKSSSTLMPPPKSSVVLKANNTNNKKNAYHTEHDESIAEVSSSHVNSLFDQLKNLSVSNKSRITTQSSGQDTLDNRSIQKTNYPSKNVCVRLPRLNLQEGPHSSNDRNFDSGFSSEDVNLNNSRKDILLDWLMQMIKNCKTPINRNKGLAKFLKPNGFSTTNANELIFEEIDGIDFAFYNNPGGRFGYMRLRPRTQKKLACAKRYELNFVLLAGVIEVTVDGQTFEMKNGDLVTIFIGTSYRMKNTSDNPALVMVIRNK